MLQRRRVVKIPLSHSISREDDSPSLAKTLVGAAWQPMTKDKFRELCETILMPRLGDYLQEQLAVRDESLDMFARELLRIGERLGRIEKFLENVTGLEQRSG